MRERAVCRLAYASLALDRETDAMLVRSARVLGPATNHRMRLLHFHVLEPTSSSFQGTLDRSLALRVLPDLVGYCHRCAKSVAPGLYSLDSPATGRLTHLAERAHLVEEVVGDGSQRGEKCGSRLRRATAAHGLNTGFDLRRHVGVETIIAVAAPTAFCIYVVDHVLAASGARGARDTGVTPVATSRHGAVAGTDGCEDAHGTGVGLVFHRSSGGLALGMTVGRNAADCTCVHMME